MNGVVIPNINNNVFLMGNGTSGSSGGANSKTLTSTELPAHTHTMDHGHSNSFALGGTTTFATSGHTHDMAHVHQALYLDNNANFQGRSSRSSGTASFNATGSSALTAITTQTVAGVSSYYRPGSVSNSEIYTTGAITDAGFLVSNTGTPSATATVSFSGAVTSHSGSTGSAGSGSSFDIRPSYISARYIIRIR
jgi:hypothetical protein